MNALRPPRARWTAWLLGLAMALALQALAPPARALDGADDPRFQTALAGWLADEEEAALPALAGLAAEGNGAAQVLLGLIDRTPALQGPWLSRRPRAERLALMRIPGGMSGRSWLGEAAPREPLAAAWAALMRVEASLGVAADLAAMGERRAAREAMVALAARERADLAQGWAAWMDPEVAYLLWPRADDALRAAIRALVPPDHAQWALMGADPGPDAWARWLAQAPGALPLRALCQARCPASAAACRQAAYSALASHNAALILGSPAEALVPQETFLASPRGQAAVLRRILLTADATGRAGLIARAGQRDACLGTALQAESERFRLVPPAIAEPQEGGAQGG